MAIPKFNEHGDLPPRVYQVPLEEAIERFGSGTAARRAVGQRLQRIHEIAAETDHLKRFVVFGSFVTEKANPNDVDIFMIMDDDFDVRKVGQSAALLFDHPAAQSHMGARVFWVRSMAALGGEQAAIDDWMVTREGRNRGVLEISE